MMMHNPWNEVLQSTVWCRLLVSGMSFQVVPPDPSQCPAPALRQRCASTRGRRRRLSSDAGCHSSHPLYPPLLTKTPL